MLNHCLEWYNCIVQVVCYKHIYDVCCMVDTEAKVKADLLSSGRKHRMLKQQFRSININNYPV